MNNSPHTPDSDLSPGSSAGALLRRQRENRGLSLESAAEATKIGKNYLAALENDRYADLPSPAYLKGFLRTYAAYLGLDPEQLIGMATAVSTGGAVETPPPAGRTAWRSRSFNWQQLLLPALLLVALLFSSIFFSNDPPSRSRSTNPAQQSVLPQPPATVLAPRSSAVFKPLSAATELVGTVTEQQPEALSPAPVPQDGFLVRMKVKRNGTLSVTIDDAASQRYDLNSGDLIEWKAASTIALDLSDPGGVELELNGAPLQLKTPASGATYVVLDANGIKP